MRRIIEVSLLLAAAGLNAREHADPRLATLTSVFVSGNNQGAERVREALGSGKTCLSLAAKAADADGTLEIAVESQTTGGQMGSFGQRSSIVSAIVTLKSGDLVWSRSERFSDAPFMNGAKTAGGLLLKRLVDAVGCRTRN